MKAIYPRLAVLLAATCLATATFDLTILHTNDVHARFEQFDGYGGACNQEESSAGECFGGVARRVSKIRQIRNETENVLLIDAGDQFQGTMWFYLYKGDATSYFMNKIGYDAMAIGNHEFDNSPAGLKKFLLDVDFPVLSSNIDATLEPSIDGLFNKSTVLTVADQKIGVIGYTFAGTPEISSTGKLDFSDEVEAIQMEVNRLKNEYGVNKIIAVGHSGFNVDKNIAQKVSGLDIVVGGHTNTFLYTGPAPSTEVPQGVYPTVMYSEDDPSASVLVVQDYTFAKYLGRLDVTFDDAGKVTKWQGNPILLDKNVMQAVDILEEIEQWAEAVRNFSSEYLGFTNVFLNGSCRLEECNLGNAIADAYVRQEIKDPDEQSWNDVSIAFVNGGSIRTSLFQGDLTIGDIKSVLPFSNTIDTITIKGVYVMEALEHSVARYDPIDTPGRFLQFSGMLVTYNLWKPPGMRVASAEVRCTDCQVPRFVPLDLEKNYKIVLPSFVVGGGDGFSMIRDNLIEHNYGNLDSSVFSDYLRAISPLTPGLERRIVLNMVEPTDPCVAGSASGIHSLLSAWLKLIVLLNVLLLRHII